MNDEDHIAARRAYNVLIASYDALTTPRPLSEYHEDMGDMLWWKFPITEAPYVGSPNDVGFAVEVEINALMRTYTNPDGAAGNEMMMRCDVGGWPGYHTHWTPIPAPVAPAK